MPRGPQKTKVEQTEKTPTPTKTPSTKPTTPKKAKESTVFSALVGEADGPVPVNVKFEGESSQARSIKDGWYTHMVKLEAPGAFSLVKTVLIESGEFQGQQAILLQPAKAFPFLKLNSDVRTRIYEFYLAPTDATDGITLEGKRTKNKDLYAKTYAGGSKNRVALLAVNREINTEATPLLYAHKLRFESTTTLLDFLSQVDTNSRAHLVEVFVKSFIKTTSRLALQFLAEATQLQNFHIDGQLTCESDPAKAARWFWGEASKFLISLSNAKGDPRAAVDVLTFGRGALIQKDDKKQIRRWDEGKVKDFREYLVLKMK